MKIMRKSSLMNPKKKKKRLLNHKKIIKNFNLLGCNVHTTALIVPPVFSIMHLEWKCTVMTDDL